MILMCVCFNYSQLFALYETLPDPSVKHMEGVVDTGINVVALVYFLVSSGGCQESRVQGKSVLQLSLWARRTSIYTVPKDVLTIVQKNFLMTRIIN